MTPTIEAVRNVGADLGVVLDTDVDRSGVVDRNGEAINRNRLIAFLATVVLRDSPGTTIVTDSTTSNGLKVRLCSRRELIDTALVAASVCFSADRDSAALPVYAGAQRYFLFSDSVGCVRVRCTPWGVSWNIPVLFVAGTKGAIRATNRVLIPRLFSDVRFVSCHTLVCM